jgi:hypothetical protein
MGKLRKPLEIIADVSVQNPGSDTDPQTGHEFGILFIVNRYGLNGEPCQFFFQRLPLVGG